MINLSQEIRVLNTTAELIENSVNNLVCTFFTNQYDIAFEVRPINKIEKCYFYILLLELTSPVNSQMIPGKEQGDTLLSLITRIGQNSLLYATNTSPYQLSKQSDVFIEWLNHEFSYYIYSASLGKNVSLKISRKDVLYLVGNRCKHTLVRSNTIIKKLAKKYNECKVETKNGSENLILEDIDAWFFDDFCGYHFTKLCELCSNLYHSIIEFIRPEFNRLFVRGDGGAYSYDIPPSLTRPDERAEFYELFNRVRNVRVPVIKTSDLLQGRY